MKTISSMSPCLVAKGGKQTPPKERWLQSYAINKHFKAEDVFVWSFDLGGYQDVSRYYNARASNCYVKFISGAL